MILFKNKKIYDHARILGNDGRDPENNTKCVENGFSYQMTNIQAAIGLAQIERLQDYFDKNNNTFKNYDDSLSTLEGISIPLRSLYTDTSCGLYTILVNVKSRISRDELINRLRINGIEALPVYIPLHKMPIYKEFTKDKSYPNSDFLSRMGISLPSSFSLKDEEIKSILRTFESFFFIKNLNS